MDVSKKIILKKNTDNFLTVPLDINWNFTGQEQLIEQYEEEVVKDVLGAGVDFELQRFPHEEDTITKKSDINYEFYFYSGGPLTTFTSWENSYITEGITVRDIYYFQEKFSNSFFKLDFYDTVDDKRQVNYLTVVLPTTQGHKTRTVFNRTMVDIKIPKFSLNYTDDREGFFLYWLKDFNFLKLNTFYVTAKFYNASTGAFVKMMNTPQSSLSPGSLFSFDPIKYFYYKVVFDYVKKTYQFFRFDPVTNVTVRVGTISKPITWFEYVNP